MTELFSEFSIVIVACAILSWLAIFAKQPLILAYMLCGLIIGPSVLGLVSNLSSLEALSNIGVILLLFLAGLVMQPTKLLGILKKTIWVNIGSSTFSFISVFILTMAWGFALKESIIMGVAMAFSSTLLAVKLLPTVTLHQQYLGNLLMAVLVVEDIVAVLAITLIHQLSGIIEPIVLILLPLKLIILIAFSLLFEQHVMRKIFNYIQRYEETTYLTAIAWCLAVAMLGHFLGFPDEIGAFAAGIAMARSPLALHIADRLRYFRDFFLVMFFFILGAKTNLGGIYNMLAPALSIAACLIIFKPIILKYLFKKIGETDALATQAGYRLGQIGEFALIISFIAVKDGVLSANTYNLVQITTIIMLIASSMTIIKKYPTPLGADYSLKRD